MKRLLSSIIFIIILLPIADAQEIAYNNFGPDNGGWDYNYGLGWTIAGDNVSAQYGVEQAMGFQSEAEGVLTDIWLAISYVPMSSPPDTVIVFLVENPNGLPPDSAYIMQEWTLTEFGSWSQWNTPHHLVGNGTSELELGKSYWLWCIAKETTWCMWCMNIDPAFTCPHTIRREGEDWLAISNETAGAFRVDVVQGFEQEIILHEGFQFISSRIEAEDTNMLDVMNEIIGDNLDFVRNSYGQSLIKIGPNWVNGIGDWIIEEGYLVKMFADDSFSIAGSTIDPASPISVPTGFKFVSYFPENAMDAMLAFGTIIGDDLDFIRNSQGQIIRKIGPNWVNGIGDCQAGEGYLVKMFADGEIIYPASAKSSGKTNIVPTHFTFKGGNAADPIYTMYIKGLEIGGEVAAFDGEKLIGALKIKSENAFDNSLAIFSTLTNEKGYSAGNQIKLKVWNSETDEITEVKYNMETIYNSYVSDMYPFEDGKYSIVNVSKGSLISDNRTLVYPNPAIDYISIVSPSEIKKVSIINCVGQTVYENNINDTKAQINLRSYESGVYFIKIETAKGLETYRVAVK
ncbi:MAG: T9SS type A sorting domain-containing protein [Bacteroidales bacterium]|nr:T9SS type A sorting domain-containing protein [Bacteroidales bacterium]